MNKRYISIEDLQFSRGGRAIFDGMNLDVPQGKITAIMGPSGTGKTTLLKLIGGQLAPARGVVEFDGKNVHQLSRSALYALRKKMGMMFQSGALLTDLSVFENVAFPLREHFDLDEQVIRDLVILKLQAVGLRGAAELMPAELSGGMARRVALARAIALDPDLIMYDEPFTGLDPITMSTIVTLIRRLNEALGVTSLLVSHDVAETLSIADYVHLIAGGKVVESGTPDELQASSSAWVQQFLQAQPDGPIMRRCYWVHVMLDFLANLGRAALGFFERLGRGHLFLFAILRGLPATLVRPSLLVRELFSVGVLSLLIILVSGLFVGMVLGLQGYITLAKFGAEESLGVVVALSLVRELGPVVAALLFAGRAGSALTAEIGLMKSTEQLSGMEMMAVDP
ncbi:unnamed protein product, partial [Cyprideis torosa]